MKLEQSLVLVKKIYVDMNSIQEEQPDECLIAEMAESFLALGGTLIKPLIVERNGPYNYTLLYGLLGLLAAKKAIGENKSVTEAVNVWIVDEQQMKAITKQLDILGI
jgi:hypothetical protein